MPYYHSTIDKALFGAYLNMARNNLRMVLTNIEEKVYGKSGNWKEDSMRHSSVIKALEKNEQPDVSKRITDMLLRDLPFLKLTVKSKLNPSANDYATSLIEFIEQLSQLRNFHCHYLHNPYKTNPEIIESLRHIFDAARRRVKIRFNYTTEEVEHLVRKIAGMVNGKRVGIEKKNYSFAFADAHEEITEIGIAFFTCLFLNKKYITLFLKQLKGFKDSRTRKTRATINTFGFFNIRIPQPKLQSNDTKEGLLMDILEDLKRCPNELFEHLSAEDQERFRVKSDNQEEENEVLQKRFSDRFPYLALRYFELTEHVKDFQFHTDLGKYNFKHYKKQVGGEERIRQLQKNMKGTGRLKDFTEDKMPEEWNVLVKRSDELPGDYMEPHIVFTNPHYHFVNNQIGVCINDFAKYPDAKTRKNPEPDIWLSIYELPALVFLHLLTKRDDGSSEIKWVLYRHNQNIKSFFIAVAEENLQPGFTKETLQTELKKYNLEYNHIPKVLIEYLLKKTAKNVQEKAEGKLHVLISETIVLLRKLDEDVEKAKEKEGGKRYKPIQSGKIADFIARDMLFLQPPVNEKEGKATSTLFQVLQARLAYYGRDKNLLNSLYKECNLIDSANAHPFLNNVPLAYSIVDYYKNYLLKRKEYLEKLREKCMKGKINSNEFHFLHLGAREKRSGDSYYKNLAKTFSEKPINFPRGLFLNAIKQQSKNKNGESIKKLLEEHERVNTIFLIQEHFKTVEEDEAQPFYNFERNYFLIDQLLDKRKQNSREARKQYYYSAKELAEEVNKIKEEIKKIPVRYDDEKRMRIIAEKNYHHLTENEKILRHIKTCDIILFLLVKDLLQSLEEPLFGATDLKNIKLRDIMPDAEKGILSMPINFKLKYGDKFICQNNMKLKNYGDFRRFLKDNRIKNLITYFPEKDITKEKLEKELEQYDKARIEVQKIILEFEKQCSERYNICIGDSDRYIDHKTILDKWQANNLNNPDRDQMEDLRSSFMHNDYPVKISLDAKEDSTIAEKLVEKARELFILN